MDDFYLSVKKQKLGDDIHPVITKNFNDNAYLKQISHAKRFLELFTMDADFNEAVKKGNDEILDAYSLDVSLSDMQYLCDEKKALEFKDKLIEMPQIARRYKGFMLEKVIYRNKFLQKDCVPANNLFRIWRQRQVNRCWGDLGARSNSIIHAPLAFELAKGCSVGCPFCGVAAGKLSEIFHYTPENSRLWLDILNKCKEIIGSAAGSGICYLATEPLDNPDYEKFALDYYRVFDRIPQITTAAADRNIERTRSVLKNSHAIYPFTIHRFSVLSLKSLKNILAAFLPEELLYVELLPQFSEAPAASFAGTGRALKSDAVLKKTDTPFGETIACITGFVVNMPEKTIRLATPCGASDKRPTGEIVLAEETFENARDFERKLSGLIEKYMLNHIPAQHPLALQPYYAYQSEEKGFSVVSGGAFKMAFQDGPGEADILKEIGYLLATAKMTAQEMAAELYDKKDFEPGLVYNKLNKLYNAGVLAEYPS